MPFLRYSVSETRLFNLLFSLWEEWSKGEQEEWQRTYFLSAC